MKVIYAKPISGQILDAIMDAERDCRKIEKIILTEEEFETLKAEANRVYPIRRQTVIKPDMTLFAGVRIEVEDNEEDF
jgi:hypothetical protein